MTIEGGCSSYGHQSRPEKGYGRRGLPGRPFLPAQCHLYPSASLAERREDIPLLTRHFIEKFSFELNRPQKDISPAAMGQLIAYAGKCQGIEEYHGAGHAIEGLKRSSRRTCLSWPGQPANPGLSRTPWKRWKNYTSPDCSWKTTGIFSGRRKTGISTGRPCIKSINDD